MNTIYVCKKQFFFRLPRSPVNAHLINENIHFMTLGFKTFFYVNNFDAEYFGYPTLLLTQIFTSRLIALLLFLSMNNIIHTNNLNLRLTNFLIHGYFCIVQNMNISVYIFPEQVFIVGKNGTLTWKLTAYSMYTSAGQ
jgi:hypothetical protein